MNNIIGLKWEKSDFALEKNPLKNQPIDYRKYFYKSIFLKRHPNRMGEKKSWTSTSQIRCSATQ